MSGEKSICPECRSPCCLAEEQAHDSFRSASLIPLYPELDAQSVDPALATVWRQFYQIDFAQQALEVECRLGRVQVAGYRIAMQVCRPAQAVATVLLLHGYYDHMGLYGHVYNWAFRQGFAVLSCDLPGHGLSSGARAVLTAFKSISRCCKHYWRKLSNCATQALASVGAKYRLQLL